MGQGYVTGLEPGTSWAYNRSYQRALNRVPTIGPKEQRHFDITYTFLADKSAVDSALQQVQKIQHDRPTEVRKSPLVELPKKLASICYGTCRAGRLWRTRSGFLLLARTTVQHLKFPGEPYQSIESLFAELNTTFLLPTMGGETYHSRKRH